MVTRSTAYDGDYYPQHPKLLNRKELLENLRRLERKLYMASQRIVLLERSVALQEALEARTTRDRRVMMRLERGVFGNYAKILAALLQFEAALAREQSQQSGVGGRPVLYGADDLDYARRASDLMRAMLASHGRPPGAPAPPPAAEAPGRWVSDDGVRAYADVGAKLAGRVESAISGELRHELARIGSSSTGAPHRTQLESDAKRAAAERARLEKKCEVLSLQNANLRAKLDGAMAEKYRDSQRAIDAAIEKREFRDSILGLVGGLRDGIIKRLGFIPASTQAEINAFITKLADAEKKDAYGDDHPMPPPPTTTSADLPPPPRDASTQRLVDELLLKHRTERA